MAPKTSDVIIEEMEIENESESVSDDESMDINHLVQLKMEEVLNGIRKAKLRAALSWSVNLDGMYKFDLPYIKKCECNLCVGVVYLCELDKAERNSLQKVYSIERERKLMQMWFHCKNWSLSINENNQLIAFSQHIEKNRLITLKIHKERIESEKKILIHVFFWAKNIGCGERKLGNLISKKTFCTKINTFA